MQRKVRICLMMMLAAALNISAGQATQQVPDMVLEALRSMATRVFIRTLTILATLLFALSGFLTGCSESESAKPQAAAPATAPSVASGETHISGPYSHANLAVYLVHGPDQSQGKKYLTLGEA